MTETLKQRLLGEARAAGFDLHLVKPVSLDTLTQALATTRV